MSEHTPPQGATTQPPGEILPAPDSSEQIFDGNVIRLRVSTYTRPSGLTVTREVLDHHGAVTMVPIEDDHILMVRQPREAAQEMMLELPAGKLDYAGEDPLEAAKRELGEEVGRDAGKWSYLGGFYTAPALLTEFIHLFIASDLTPSAIEPLEEEEIEVVRVPLSHLPTVIDQVRDAKTLIGLLRIARALGI